MDSTFAVHNDLKGNTGGTLTLGKGSVTLISRKQQMNTHNSKEAGLVAADDVVGNMIWKENVFRCKRILYSRERVADFARFRRNPSLFSLTTTGLPIWPLFDLSQRRLAHRAEKYASRALLAPHRK